MKELVSDSISKRSLCRVFLKYDINYRYYFPLLANDKLFLGAKEDDFIINGYSIRRFIDVRKIEIKDDLCITILRKEGIVDHLVSPDIDIANWETVFKSLRKMNKNIIVEKESFNEDEAEFVIGRIEKVFKKFVYMRHFDADGIWVEDLYRIPYAGITSVSFGSRYVEMYSKYINDLPRQ